MRFRNSWLGMWIIALALAFAASIARAAPQTGLFTSELSLSALPAGQTAVAAIVFNVAPGYHAQSHHPLNLNGVNYIAFDVKMDANPALEFLDPIFPEGKIENSLVLGKQSVYTGRITIFIPIRIKGDAPVGDITISGNIIWQACNSNTCYPPEKRAFSISTGIVPASRTVSLTNTDLFSHFDQSVFAKGPTTATAPATLPAEVAESILPSPPTSVTIDILGYSFSLDAGNLLLALPVAFGTGILFNLMPCVLPVLPLKAIGFFEVSKHNRRRCIVLGLSFSAGIIAVFLVLGFLLIAMKGIIQFTWGQQFSSPWFVWPMVVILVAMSLGMFGLFEFVVPEKISNYSPNHESLGGNFAFGMLAAALSTPCTAPMFPPLLAWAIAEPVATGMLSIVMVGIGMAMPYLILSAFPKLARRVPRTGPWSLMLKQTMGFLILAVAVLFAGGRLIHSREFLWGVFAVIAAGMLFLLVRTIQLSGRVRPIAISLVIAALVVMISAQITMGLTEKTDLEWQPFSQQAFTAARATGQPVLVEFTANWCSNCLGLELTVYRDHKAISALNRANVILLRADLTDSDAPGQPLLNELNPGGGIPLTAIYWPGNPNPSKLTSWYSTGNLLDVLEHPSGKN